MLPASRVLLANYKDAEVSAQIPELFKRAGCIVEVFCNQDSWLLKNKYWDLWQKAIDHTPEAYGQSLEKLLRQRTYDKVVFTDDFTARIINKQITDPVLFQKISPLTKIEHRDLLGSKAALSELCQKYNILTPAFALYTNDFDLEATLSKLSFPVLIKINESSSGKGVLLASTMSEAIDIIKILLPEQKNNLVFQEYIKGDNIAVESLFKKGVLLGYAASKVLHNTEGEFSISRVREYSSLPELKDQLVEIGEKLGLDGFANMTFMRSQINKQYYLVEADLRPQGWCYLVKFAEVDFSTLIPEYVSTNSIHQSMPIISNHKTQVIRFFSRDIKWSIAHGDWVSVIQWFFNWNGRWRYVGWHDQKFFWKNIFDILKYTLYQIESVRPIMRALKKWYRRLV